MPKHSERALASIPDDAAPLPDGIHRIALPTPFAVGRINTYLIEGDPLTLVDCGVNTGVALDTLEASLGELGHRIEDLELILLTHEHLDHLGLAEVLARRADCPVAAFAPLQGLFDPDTGPAAALTARLAWATAQLERGGYPSMLAVATQSSMALALSLGSRPQIDLPLVEGDVVRAGSRDWEVLHRPGHSLSDLVFAERATGVAIAGDHILSSMSPNPTLSAPHEVRQPDARTERARSLLLYLESIRKTAVDGHQLMLTGHGPSVGAPAALIEERLAFHDRRAEKIGAMLSGEPQTVYDLACRMWKNVPIVQPHLTHSEVIGHLDLLVERGQAAEVPAGEGVVGFVSG